jgi:hypothetical protein
MQPDAQAAMLAAINLGPDHCPPDLFAGNPRAILAGLKCHANTIAHARQKGLEETFPQTRDLLGAEAFHAYAERYLARPETLAVPIAAIGASFPAELTGQANALALVEWTCLQSHGAVDAAPLDLDAVRDLGEDALLLVIVARHPAARRLPGDLLVARPHAEVCVHQLTSEAAGLFDSLRSPRQFSALLDTDAVAATKLVQCGALAIESHP